jgi:glycine/serine hydroxymethyltransferase
MGIKQEIIRRLKTLTSHNNIEILTKGNSAIFSALHSVKKEVLIPEEGGWITYQQYPDKLKLKTTKVKTHNSVIDLTDLKNKTKSADAFLYQNPGGYHAEQPMEEIYQICKENNCLVILDVSGGIGTKLCNGDYSDIIVCSFGRWKLIEANTGGFISCKDKEIFNKIKDSFKSLNNEETLNTINNSVISLQNRINFLSKKRKKIINELKEFDIVNKSHLGFVLIVKYDDSNKEKLINYCENNSLEFTECPRYIRINQKAISIEVKRLKE